MKNNVRIINCARGGIINEKDLNWALENKLIEGAALDVFEKEPITDSPLLNHDNIITTPHLGASTEEAQINVAISLANDLIRALKTGAARNSVNMPYIKSDEWKKIKPYVKLAEKLGSFYSQFKNGRISSIKLDYSGEIAGCNSSIITSAAIKGLLDVILQEPVNIINSQSIANKRNIKIIESKNDNVKDYGNLVVLEVESDKEIGKIGGTVFENNELRIVLIDDYKIDLVPEGHMLLISHNDKPGMIGRVGNILGNSDINIATMQVGRKKPRGEAIMSLSVDEPIDNETLKEIEKIEGLEKVRVANIQ